MAKKTIKNTKTEKLIIVKKATESDTNEDVDSYCDDSSKRKSNIKSKVSIPENTESNSIILHLPICGIDSESDDDNESSEKTRMSIKESDKFDDDEDTKENNLIVYLSEEESDDYDVNYFKKELNKKEQVIKKLQEEITKSENADSASAHKVLNTKKLNSKVISINKQFSIGEKTKIACWWCTETFDNIPCHIPEKYYDNKYYVFGCFCSCQCALAYVLKDDEYRLINRVSLLKRMYAELYETQDPLCAAAPKEVLQKFGGSQTIEEYRTIKGIKIKEYKMNMAPIPCYFEETCRCNN